MNKRRLQKELKNKKDIAECAKAFGVMGDATRLKICYLLCRHPELSVGETAEVLGLSISTVSHSLRKLKKLKLVRFRRDRKQVFYCLYPTPLTHYIRKTLTGARR